MSMILRNFVLIVVVMELDVTSIYTVSLFGHRRIEDLRLLDARLTPLITELIQAKSYVVFLVGRNGEFDEYVASVIKRAQKVVGKETSDIILVLPYKVADVEYYEEYYDSIVIPRCVHGVHFKRAITLKNRWMVEQSDLSIFYVEREKGGAYAAMKYAEDLNKEMINLCAPEDL